ncbi:MAG: NAD-dependent epimerase/dehydratase family protein [Candidatus Krumholzibacteriia bacterium]
MTLETTRRAFLKTLTLAGAAVGLGGLGSPFTRHMGAARAADHALTVLVLGGTGQTGPHLVADLLDRGHTVTLFNRGRRSEDLFPDVECLVGDRQADSTEGLAALQQAVAAGRAWDVCIDIWPHIPKIVENTAALLQSNVGRYMFVSSLSAYADHSQPDQDETAPVSEAPDADTTEFTMDLFGPFKAECENRVRRYYPDNHTIVRPGLIVGPRDFSFRGGYWPVRVRRGGEVLAPGSGDDRIQLIDGRDLTRFEVLCMEQGTGGTFNVVGPAPDHPLTMRTLLETCRAATGADARFIWADAAFLEEQGVGPWMDMPCWIPATGEYAGFGSRNVDRAVAAGLRFRPLADTVRDTLAWYDGLTAEQRDGVTGRAGLAPEREAEVLAAWHAIHG